MQVKTTRVQNFFHMTTSVKGFIIWSICVLRFNIVRRLATTPFPLCFAWNDEIKSTMESYQIDLEHTANTSIRSSSRGPANKHHSSQVLLMLRRLMIRSSITKLCQPSWKNIICWNGLSHYESKTTRINKSQFLPQSSIGGLKELPKASLWQTTVQQEYSKT